MYMKASMFCAVTPVLLLAMAACGDATGASDCGAKTTAVFRDEISNSYTITSITGRGQSRLIDVTFHGSPSTSMTFAIADTTAVFERVGSGTPRPSYACRLAVGEVVETPLGDGFGDVIGDPPPPTLRQIVIDR
jgi:hypothetical protein